MWPSREPEEPKNSDENEVFAPEKDKGRRARIWGAMRGRRQTRGPSGARARG